MRCRCCARWRARQWEKSDAWERAHSNEDELWSQEPLRNQELVEQAYALRETDPWSAFGLYLDAAEAGSAWAMEAVAWHYWMGIIVAADLAKAQEYYCRAINVGSWMATTKYAQILADHGQHDESDRILENGVASDFVPAFFWLALLRHDRCRSRKTCREIKPMLEYAAGKGHPQAQIHLARFMIRGRFGLREIPAGIRWILRLARNEIESADDQDAPIHATAGA